jgi:hypothetical protein
LRLLSKLERPRYYVAHNPPNGDADEASSLDPGSAAAACTHLLLTSEAPQLRVMDIGGTRLAYVEQGHGDAVVFVHGAAGDCASKQTSAAR